MWREGGSCAEHGQPNWCHQRAAVDAFRNRPTVALRFVVRLLQRLRGQDAPQPVPPGAMIRDGQLVPTDRTRRRARVLVPRKAVRHLIQRFVFVVIMRRFEGTDLPEL